MDVWHGPINNNMEMGEYENELVNWLVMGEFVKPPRQYLKKTWWFF